MTSEKSHIKFAKSERTSGYILPVISNAKYNEYLKEIAKILGIEKRVTSHLARHSISSFSLKTNDFQNLNL